MPDLQILLLGSPEIRWKGNQYSIQRRIPRSMLFYLAARGGMVTRNELILLFWQDQSPEQARTRLREALSRLRQMLPVADLITTTNDLVGLDFEQVFVDQREFDRFLDEFGQLPWKIPVNDPLPAEVQRNLIDAGRLWRGSRYLAGADLPSSYEMDNWLMLSSQHYEQLYRQVFERLSSHAQALGDFERAVYYAEQALESDCLDESLHARILELLIADNQIERARNYFKQVEVLFVQQYGAQPGEQLLQISKRLNLPTPVTNIRQSLPWHARQSLEAPFIGRQQALAQLWRCYQKNASVFLSGEIGIGKTRLLQEFLNRQKLSSYLIASRCTPGGEQSPFQSTLDSERQYGLIRAYFHQIPAIYARQILRLLPELAEIRPELLEENETFDLSEEHLTLEACRYYVLGLTQTQSVLFVIEDIQWIDTFTLEALDYVIRRYPFGTRAMLIVSGRYDECQPATKHKIRSWQASGHLEIIELERMGLGDVYNLASAVLPGPLSQPFVEQLTAETGGNPYFILETLRETLARMPELDISKALPLPFPIQLAMVIRSRLEGLSPAARQLLDVAAILGNEFNPEVIQLALEMDRQIFEQGLAELETGRLIEVQPEKVEICYGFIHTKFREILLLDLKSLQKQKLHRQVTRAFIAIYGDRVSRSMLAYHCQQAGDRVKAYEYMLEAALEAYQSNQLQEATDLFAKTAGLIDRDGGSLTPEMLYRFYRSWLNALLAQNDLDAYRQVCDEMLELGQKRRTSLLIGAALSSRALLHLHQQTLEQGLTSILQAMPYLEQVDNAYEYLSAHNTRATLLYMTGRLDEAMQIFQRALVIAESVVKPPTELIIARSYTHEQIATIYQIRGWPTRSRQHAQHALADSIETQDLLKQASAYSYLTFACFHLGEYAQARMYNDFGLRMSWQTGFARQIGYHYMNRSWIELTIGNIAASLRDAISTHEYGIQTQEPLMAAMAERCYADIYLTLNQPMQALTYYQHALAYLPDGIAGLDILWRAGFVHAFLEQTDQAITILQQSIGQAEKVGADFITFEAQICYAWVLFRQGNYEHALQLAETIRTETEKRSLAKQSISLELLLGEIARQTHQPDLARSYFESVAEKSALLNCPWQEIHARIFLAQVHQDQGGSSSAQEQRIQFLLNQIESTITEDDRLPDGLLLKETFATYRKDLPTLRLSILNGNALATLW